MTAPSNPSIPYGLCQCGCGRPTTISDKTTSREGYIKGMPRKYCHGHGSTIRRSKPLFGELDGHPVAYVDVTHGRVTVIDKADLGLLGELKWNAKWDRHTKTYYARSNPRIDGKRVHIQLHRLLFGLTENHTVTVDHINGDGLDNRRSVNLRIATNQQNCFNARPKQNFSGFKGVTWHGPTRQWRARICTGSTRLHLGLFPTAEAAYAAYVEAAKEYHGEFARTQ